MTDFRENSVEIEIHNSLVGRLLKSTQGSKTIKSSRRSLLHTQQYIYNILLFKRLAVLGKKLTEVKQIE